MVIKKTIDGIEREIELTKQEMIDIACELDIINIVDALDDFLANIDIDDFDDDVQEMYQKYLNAPVSICEKFWRECAEGIVSLADEKCISLCDDLTDIFYETITEELLNFEWEEN